MRIHYVGEKGENIKAFKRNKQRDNRNTRERVQKTQYLSSEKKSKINKVLEGGDREAGATSVRGKGV